MKRAPACLSVDQKALSAVSVKPRLPANGSAAGAMHSQAARQLKYSGLPFPERPPAPEAVGQWTGLGRSSGWAGLDPVPPSVAHLAAPTEYQYQPSTSTGTAWSTGPARCTDDLQPRRRARALNHQPELPSPQNTQPYPLSLLCCLTSFSASPSRPSFCSCSCFLIPSLESLPIAACRFSLAALDALLCTPRPRCINSAFEKLPTAPPGLAQPQSYPPSLSQKKKKTAATTPSHLVSSRRLTSPFLSSSSSRRRARRWNRPVKSGSWLPRSTPLWLPTLSLLRSIPTKRLALRLSPNLSTTCCYRLFSIRLPSPSPSSPSLFS